MNRTAGFTPETPLEIAPTGAFFVLMVAIDHYTSPDIAALKNPVLDANNLLTVLRERYDLGIPDTDKALNLRANDPRYTDDAAAPIWVYDTLRVKCLYNEKATKGTIREHLKKVAEAIGPDDAFLMYFAGHGITENNVGYILAQNAEKDADQTGWLDFAQCYNPFTNYLKTQICRNMLLVLDCCHAGAVTLGKQGQKNAEKFVRKVLTSCGPDRLAADGTAGKGSPFANALVTALNGNTHPVLGISHIAAAIDSTVQIQTFSNQYITYTDLPTDQVGQGDFALRLKGSIAAALPARQLADSFIKHLNFDDQKKSFKKHFRAIEKGDLHILATSAYNFDVQQLLRTVLFDFTQTYSSINLDPGDPIVIWPNTLPHGGFWEALQRSLHGAAPEGSSRESTVKHIVDRLQVTEEFRKKPFVIAIGFESSMEAATKALVQFAVEFMDLLHKEKSKREHRIFAKLFLILSELTPGKAQFQLKDTFVLPDSGQFGIAPIDQVSNNHIDKYVFEEWYTPATDQLGATLPALTTEDIFPNDDHSYEVLSFIYTIADKLHIPRETLVHNLGIIKS